MLQRSKNAVLADRHVALLFLRLTGMALCIGVAVNVVVAGLILLVASVGG